MARTVAEHLGDTLARAGVQRVYGIVGDSLNPVTDAIRRGGSLRWVDVRHEETAAFAVGAEAQLTGNPGDSCGHPELPRRDADEALEVVAELALIRESGTGRNLCQGEVTVLLQEVPGPLHAAQDDVLVWGKPGGPLELAGEVVGAKMGDRRQLLQGRAGVEVLLDVLDDGAEPPPRQRAVRPALRPAGGQDVADQVDGQDVGQRLGG